MTAQFAETVACPECGHPTRRHIPHRLPADLWRCNYGGCQCVVRWSPTAEEGRHQHVWENGKCATCAARDPDDAERIMATLHAIDGNTSPLMEVSPDPQQNDGTSDE